MRTIYNTWRTLLVAIVACQYELGLGNAMASVIEWLITYPTINDTVGANSCWVFLLRNLLKGVLYILALCDYNACISMLLQ